MNKDKNQTLAILILCMIVIILCFMCGCSSVKYSYKRDDVEIEARYYRFLNQEIEGLSLNTELFQAQLEEQEADNSDAVKAITEGAVAGATHLVRP